MPPTYDDAEYQAAHDEIYSHPLGKLESVLPPGISQVDFETALEEFAQAVGLDAVISGEGLKSYVDPYEIPESLEQRKVPSAAVCPSSIKELQAALNVANKYKIPVWTFSRGKNLGYGGPAPALAGSVAMDLHRMNKVIEVNEKFAYAVVEPGVTFGDLYAHCAENKLKVWPSTASLGWGSVIGNTLDRGMGFVPTGVHHENMLGLEVVLADGDVVRTGQFAMTSSPSAHLTRLSFGPSIEGLFLQSNLGIVTKMGIALTPQPQAYMAVQFDMPDFGDIAIIVDVFGRLRRTGVIPYGTYVCNIIGQTTGHKKHVEWWDQPGAMPEWRVKEIQEELGQGYWTVKFGLYGPKGIVEAQYAEVARVVTAEMPTGRLRRTLFAAEVDGGLLEAASVEGPLGGMYVGVPSLFTLQFVNYYQPRPDTGSVGAHSAYSPIMPLDGATVLEWVTTARGVYESFGQDLVCDFYIHERYAMSVMMLFYDKKNAEKRIASDKLLHRLFKEGSKRGFAKYRSHIAYMDMTSDLFDFNNHAYRRFLESLKGTLDPNGILSPGKMGVWPQRFKELFKAAKETEPEQPSS